ncbi:hypothetical protein EV360DRAFT_87404 [Lentinula raphanica]|nr:hypothetical protein EV360DRAFT_87404 [Lentinula raphanica]
MPLSQPKCRTHAQVLADAARDQADLKALLTKMKNNYCKLAEMEVNKEEQEAYKHSTRVESSSTRLSGPKFVKITLPKKAQKPAATPIKTTSKKTPITTVQTKKLKVAVEAQPSLKKEASSESVIEISDPGTPSPRTKTLPDFMVAMWNTHGTDTTYGLLGPQLLEVVKEAVKGLWPGSDYKVKKGDAFYEKFYNHCTEAQSKVGAKAQVVVEAFFAQGIYAKSAVECQGYALYALQKDGPLLYQTPVPHNIKEHEPDYMDPSGSFLSDHVVQVIKLERAFRMYTSTGNKLSRVPGFTLTNVNNAVEAYAQSASKMSESRWNRLKDLCGIPTSDTVISSMENHEVFKISASRHLMYNASSPPPES